MVVINLTWQASSFFSASLLIASFVLGAMINPDLTYNAGKQPLCLVCPEKVEDRTDRNEMFFSTGATFVYHVICFIHFGGMAAGLVGLLMSLAFHDAGSLKVLFAIILPVVWVAAWVVQLVYLAIEHDWMAYDATATYGDEKIKYVPSEIWLWWVIFSALFASVTALILVSAYGIWHDTYVLLG